MQQAVDSHSASDTDASVGKSNDLAAPGRRGVLTGMALLPLAALATGAAGAAGVDPAIVAVERFQAIDARCPGDAFGRDVELRWLGESTDAMAVVMRTRATTPAGLAAKLGLVEVGDRDTMRLLNSVIGQLRNWA